MTILISQQHVANMALQHSDHLQIKNVYLFIIKIELINLIIEL